MYFIGVDVGTGSARASVVSDSGTLLSTSVQPITMWNPLPQFYEQSSEEIWKATCSVVKDALKDSGVKFGDIAGIGFDATCSLVVLDKENKPISVSPTHRDSQNIIVWMDHRAVEQADRINKTGHPVLENVGGTISPEMETPKLLWIKENLPDIWSKAGSFLDLADYLVFHATGVQDRSLCTTVCKWTYQPSRSREHGKDTAGWDPTYFSKIGLPELTDAECCKRIGTNVRNIGESVGNGLTTEAALQLGLAPNTPVSTALIDAHAGGLGILGTDLNDVMDVDAQNNVDLKSRMAIICGTSSCHMSVSAGPVLVNGVWGPYESAMVPGLYLSEGGQSSTGSLLEYIVDSHPAGHELRFKAEKENVSVFALLNNIVSESTIKSGLFDSSLLVKDVHVLPYYHGNRSPRADPSLVGMISGITLDNSPENLAIVYLAAVHSLAHGTKHIIDAVNASRVATGEVIIDTLLLCGGLSKNPVFVQAHADVTGCRVALPRESEAVLLGAAVAASVAAKCFPSIPAAMKQMNKLGSVVFAKSDEAGKLHSFHAAKHEIFHQLYKDQQKYKEIMSHSFD